MTSALTVAGLRGVREAISSLPEGAETSGFLQTTPRVISGKKPLELSVAEAGEWGLGASIWRCWKITETSGLGRRENWPVREKVRVLGAF